jgi:hypothetical protein
VKESNNDEIRTEHDKDKQDMNEFENNQIQLNSNLIKEKCNENITKK